MRNPLDYLVTFKEEINLFLIAVGAYITTLRGFQNNDWFHITLTVLALLGLTSIIVDLFIFIRKNKS